MRIGSITPPSFQVADRSSAPLDSEHCSDHRIRKVPAMPRELDEWHARTGGYVPRPRFESYAEKYADYFVMQRRDGIIELRMHTGGGPAQFGFAVHNAWAQAWQEIGSDPDNEVLILTG